LQVHIDNHRLPSTRVHVVTVIPSTAVREHTRRASFIERVDNGMTPRIVSEQLETAHSRSSAARNSASHSRSLSSNKTVTPIPPSLLPSAPASPPTPAPSPTPHQRPPTWQSSDEEDDAFLLNARIHFTSLSSAKKQRFLEGVLGLCDSQLLSFVSSYVTPRLRKDPFQVFPTELCLRVSFPLTIARLSRTELT
jgi:F-box and WD-40 domain protein CDC4